MHGKSADHLKVTWYKYGLPKYTGGGEGFDFQLMVYMNNIVETRIESLLRLSFHLVSRSADIRAVGYARLGSACRILYLRLLVCLQVS